MGIFQLDKFYHQLFSALDALTWQPDKQLDYTHRLSVGIDELALDFDDIYRLAQGKAQEGLVPAAILDAIDPIDAHLKIMTEVGPGAWTESALRNTREWHDLRDLAQSAKSRLLTEQHQVGIGDVRQRDANGNN